MVFAEGRRSSDQSVPAHRSTATPRATPTVSRRSTNAAGFDHSPTKSRPGKKPREASNWCITLARPSGWVKLVFSSYEDFESFTELLWRCGWETLDSS